MQGGGAPGSARGGSRSVAPRSVAWLLSLGVLAVACGAPPERAGVALPETTEAETSEAAPPPAASPPPTGAMPETPPAVERDGTRRVTITAAGDLVPNALAMRSIRHAPTEDEGYRAFLGAYAEALRDGEIAYLNLEVPLVDDVVPLDGGWPRSLTERPRRAPVLGATPALARVLRAIGLDVVGLANNHAFDQGSAGLRRTRALALEAGLAAPGAGESAAEALAPAIVDEGGVRVAFVSLTTSLNRRATDEPRFFVGRGEPEDALADALASARRESDLVVAVVHWSTDFVMEADGEQRRLARRLVDLGADVVLGTGPHVLHEVARLPSPRGEALVAYSLGNVASGMGRAYRLGHPPHDYIHPANVRPEARDGLLLRALFAISPEGRVAIEGLEGVPFWTENDYRAAGDDATVRVVRLADAGPEVCAERLPVVRSAIGAAVTLDVECE